MTNYAPHQIHVPSIRDIRGLYARAREIIDRVSFGLHAALTAPIAEDIPPEGTASLGSSELVGQRIDAFLKERPRATFENITDAISYIPAEEARFYALVSTINAFGWSGRTDLFDRLLDEAFEKLLKGQTVQVPEHTETLVCSLINTLQNNGCNEKITRITQTFREGLRASPQQVDRVGFELIERLDKAKRGDLLPQVVDAVMRRWGDTRTVDVNAAGRSLMLLLHNIGHQDEMLFAVDHLKSLRDPFGDEVVEFMRARGVISDPPVREALQGFLAESPQGRLARD